MQVRRAVRATLILFPLLGMTNLLFFINPKVSTRRFFLNDNSNVKNLNIPEHQYVYILHFIFLHPQSNVKNLNIPEHQYVYMVVNSVLKSSQVHFHNLNRLQSFDSEKLLTWTIVDVFQNNIETKHSNDFANYSMK